MSWKKELLKGLVEVKAEVARQQGIIATQDLTIQRQQAVIEKLLDRIQAPSFRELKVAANSEAEALRQVAEFYDPLKDEDLAGMTLPMEERLDGQKAER